MSEISYQFEMNPNKKGKCPACGHENCFNYYERNGMLLHESFGRCSRVNECGYHKMPDFSSALDNLSAPNIVSDSKDEINSSNQSLGEIPLSTVCLRHLELCKKMGWSRAQFEQLKHAGMLRAVRVRGSMFIIFDINE